MVNIFKHRKINKNPFVKYLKAFSNPEDKSTLRDYTNLKDYMKGLEEDVYSQQLTEGKGVYLYNNQLYLVNLEYYSFGCIIIPTETLKYDSGYFYFKSNPLESDVEINVGLSYGSKEELYKFVDYIDTFGSKEQIKELFLAVESQDNKFNLTEDMIKNFN